MCKYIFMINYSPRRRRRRRLLGLFTGPSKYPPHTRSRHTHCVHMQIRKSRDTLKHGTPDARLTHFLTLQRHQSHAQGLSVKYKHIYIYNRCPKQCVHLYMLHVHRQSKEGHIALATHLQRQDFDETWCVTCTKAKHFAFCYEYFNHRVRHINRSLCLKLSRV